MSAPAWRITAELNWTDPTAGQASLAAALASLGLPAPFAQRVQAEVSTTAAQASRRAAPAAVQVRLLRTAGTEDAALALWGFFCLERWPAAGQCVLEVFLYPEQ